MSPAPARLPTRATIQRLREMYERPLTPEEFRRQAAIPLTAAEIAENMELVRWFRARYPTGQDRSEYIRRAMARWKPPDAE